MSIIQIFSDAYIVKLLENKDIIDYISQYQIVFDKITSLTIKND